MNKCLLLFLTLLLGIANVCAEEVFLRWDASPSPEVSGYKIYFKAHSSDLPFDGVDAHGGLSPLDVGNALTATISIPDNNSAYYFTCTAYDGAGYESSYSNIVSNREISDTIDLHRPLDNALQVIGPVIFEWSAPAVGLEYTLYYGTDSSLATFPLPGGPGSTLPPPNTWLIFFLLTFLFLGLKNRINFRPWRLAVGLLGLGLILNACGGGGGAGTENGTITTRSISLSAAQSYLADDLKPGTTYFWKVTGTDAANPAAINTSKTARFTTADQ
jgi:hypothetical protein